MAFSVFWYLLKQLCRSGPGNKHLWRHLRGFNAVFNKSTLVLSVSIDNRRRTNATPPRISSFAHSTVQNWATFPLIPLPLQMFSRADVLLFIRIYWPPHQNQCSHYSPYQSSHQLFILLSNHRLSRSSHLHLYVMTLKWNTCAGFSYHSKFRTNCQFLSETACWFKIFSSNTRWQIHISCFIHHRSYDNNHTMSTHPNIHSPISAFCSPRWSTLGFTPFSRSQLCIFLLWK